ncbi:NAD(P)H-dependent flavin oxidoreductase [Alloalcanivorax marinus]|uniref:NAD(P)H-dependent flavin oxidoreductase n=1 Tax=Alloalcanivorax marinus TaxID=1177169 RepID=UPI001931A639|nr:nitronate monooxygenase [Alloalcanivorax marinus]MBL7251223.1 nitronate monooxygenase [Alloalcanivorax marinus]
MPFQDYTLIQAPMAGGINTTELTVGAARAGALASIGAGYLSGAALEAAVSAARQGGAEAFAVNLFIPGEAGATETQWRAAREALVPCYQAAGVDLPEAFAELPGFDEQFEAMLEARPAFFSFTFGRLDKARRDACRARGIGLIGTATNLAEARAQAEDGVNAIVLQGEEAGGHRGSVEARGAGQPLAALLEACGEVGRPLIAAGGLMDGADMARVLGQGAAAAQLGTAFLSCPEAGTAPAWREALAAAGPDATAVTAAVSGRLARGLANAWMDQRAPREIAPYPDQHRLTAPLRKAAGAEWKSLWAGTGAHRSRTLPVEELVATLLEECRAAG